MATNIVGLQINADLLDGLSASDFAQVSGNTTFSGSVTATNFVVSNGGTIGSVTTPSAVSIASGGNVSLTENLVFASNKGIDFSVTSDASGSTSELFDDYEEGTWTPEYTPGSGAFGAISHFSGGFYTKIGRFVHIQGFILSSNITIGTASGNLLISGLPYAVASITGPGDKGVVSIPYSVTFADDYPSGGLMTEGGSTINLYYRNLSDGPSLLSQVTDLDTGANKNQMHFHGWYITGS